MSGRREKPSNTNERRSARRYRLDQLIRMDLGREVYIQGKGINLSESGIYCQVSEPLGLYARVFLLIEPLPSQGPEETISLEGQVMREETLEGRYYAAIQFSSVRMEDRARFSTLLTRLSGK